MYKSITKLQIKHIRALHQKKYRQKYRQFFVEGTKSVFEFLNSIYSCQNIFASHEWLEQNNLNTYNSTPIYTASNKEMQQISALKSPPGVMAVFEQPKENLLNAHVDLVLALEDIRDPGNLGTIIRTAEWFGLQQIVCSLSCAEVFNPKVVQASMGSLARVEVVYIDLLHLKKSLPNHKMVLADMKGENVANFNWNKNILVIGNEANGASKTLKEVAENVVTIPRMGKAESLNAAMSTGIILAFAKLR